MLVTKQLTVAIVLVWKNYMEVNGYRQLLCYQHSSKHLLLCLTQERNSYRFWEWQNDHFWLNYPFKKDLKDTSKHFTDIQSHHHICSDLSGAYPYLCTLQSTMLPSKKRDLQLDSIHLIVSIKQALHVQETSQSMIKNWCYSCAITTL